MQEIRDDAVRVDQLILRRTASNLKSSQVVVDPVIWIKDVLDNWSTFWNRDDSEAFPDGMDRYLNWLPQHEKLRMEAMTGKALQDTIKEMKSVSMRGCDGWAYAELKCLPICSLRILARIFAAIESGSPWPTTMVQWFVILLKKDESPTPSWKAVRSISVAAGLYRVWARFRARELLKGLAGRAVGLVRPNLATPMIWGFISDYLDYASGQAGRPAGLVLDIVKTFNSLHRGVLFRILLKFGVPTWMCDAWNDALNRMIRRVQINKCHYNACGASTGIPEGDPISVVGMFGFSYLFSIVIDNLSNFRRDQVLPATYADNWEILCASLRPLLQLLPGIDEFLQTCRLPVAVDKCWGWSLHPADRKVLRTQTRNSRVRTGGKRLVRLAGLPLSFWHRVAVVRKSIWKHFAWLSNCCGTQNSAY